MYNLPWRRFLQAINGLFRTMRPKQWTKNVLFVFPAIIFDGQLTDLNALLRVTIACILLILMSGTVYIINDLVDIEKDRLHPKKKYRALPSGKLSPSIALLAAIIIPIITLAISSAFDWRLTVVLTTYLVLQIAYSFVLKNVVIIDVLTIMIGFLLRVLAGVVVIQVQNFSPWLYGCAGLLALFLAIGKRRQDLVQLGADDAVKTRAIYKEYNIALLDDMLRIVITSTLITYILYTIEVETIRVADLNLSLVTVPVVMYGLFRYLYLIHIRGEGGAPDEVLLRDRPLQLTLVAWSLMFVVLIYFVPSTLR